MDGHFSVMLCLKYLDEKKHKLFHIERDVQLGESSPLVFLGYLLARYSKYSQCMERHNVNCYFEMLVFGTTSSQAFYNLQSSME